MLSKSVDKQQSLLASESFSRHRLVRTELLYPGANHARALLELE